MENKRGLFNSLDELENYCISYAKVLVQPKNREVFKELSQRDDYNNGKEIKNHVLNHIKSVQGGRFRTLSDTSKTVILVNILFMARSLLTLKGYAGVEPSLVDKMKLVMARGEESFTYMPITPAPYLELTPFGDPVRVGNFGAELAQDDAKPIPTDYKSGELPMKVTRPIMVGAVNILEASDEVLVMLIRKAKEKIASDKDMSESSMKFRKKEKDLNEVIKLCLAKLDGESDEKTAEV